MYKPSMLLLPHDDVIVFYGVWSDNQYSDAKAFF